MITPLLLVILDDQYNYMYDQFFKKVKILGKCRACEIYEGIKLPEYYITRKKEESVFRILRYDKTQEYE